MECNSVCVNQHRRNAAGIALQAKGEPDGEDAEHQHRGQESAGIVAGQSNHLHLEIGMGLVADIFDLLALVDIIIFEDEPTDAQLFFCDLDGSGVIDVMDIINLSNLILGIWAWDFYY